MEEEEEVFTVQLTRSEITTITGALNHWQDEVRETEVDGELVQQIPFNLELHFFIEPPLPRKAVFELSQRLQALCR